jgi:hypothetical protein
MWTPSMDESGEAQEEAEDATSTSFLLGSGRSRNSPNSTTDRHRLSPGRCPAPDEGTQIINEQRETFTEKWYPPGITLTPIASSNDDTSGPSKALRNPRTSPSNAHSGAL